MFSFLTKRFWQLRKQRKQIIATIRSKNFYVIRNEGLGCHLCEERSYEICTPITQTSLTGEEFYFRSYPIAYLCARCQTVSKYSDISEHDMLISEWLKNPVSLFKAK
jgi:hypothetical protein